MLKKLVDPWTFFAIGVPTSGKELPEFVGYAQVTGVGRHVWAIALGDLTWNIRVPESMKRR